MTISEFFNDWKDTTKELSESERGRLASAIIAASNGDNYTITGNEKYIFPIYKSRLEREKLNSERTV